jgi:hypothetical protein
MDFAFPEQQLHINALAQASTIIKVMAVWRPMDVIQFSE